MSEWITPLAVCSIPIVIGMAYVIGFIQGHDAALALKETPDE